jgi:hypothetical protein
MYRVHIIKNDVYYSKNQALTGNCYWVPTGTGFWYKTNLGLLDPKSSPLRLGHEMGFGYMFHQVLHIFVEYF